MALCRIENLNLLPLQTLAKAISGSGEGCLFSNQTVMFRVIMVFLSDSLLYTNGEYTGDDLRRDLYIFLESGYIEKEKGFHNLHQTIYRSISGETDDRDKNPYHIRTEAIEKFKADCSKMLSGRKPLPLPIRKEIDLGTDFREGMLKRLFWILQYYAVYYGRGSEERKEVVERNLPVPQIGVYREYYVFAPQFARNMYENLRERCMAYSETVRTMTSSAQLSFLSLSRIVLELIIYHHENRNWSFSLPGSFVRPENAKDRDEQQKFYFRSIDSYGKQSFDRYQVLLEWADRNCYASAELGDLHFHGAALHIGPGNEYRLPKNNQLAAECYKRAVELATPTYPYACWSYADLLVKKYKREGKTDEELLDQAVKYLEMAGDYPAAWNSLARIQELRISAIKNSGNCDESLLNEQYRSALKLAIRAAKAGWYYANSFIAQFLLDHAKDKALMKILESDPVTAGYMDIKKLFGVTASHNNLWAMHKLALLFLEEGRKAEARIWLDKACVFSYARAFFTIGEQLCDSISARITQYEKASDLGYPNASLGLAEIYRDEGEIMQAKKYTELAMAQIYALESLPNDLLEKILQMREWLMYR